MARKKWKRAVPEEAPAATNYYKLHTKAVEDLVNADESNSPEISREELNRYRSGPKLPLSEGVRAILIKMWFAGSVCFFIFWGLSAYVTARIDLLVVFGIALGMVTDLLTNNCLRFLAKTEGSNDWCMMFPKPGNIVFFFNIVYAVILLFCVDMFYNLINMALLAVFKHAYLGVGPILFAVFYTGFDMLFIGAKRLFKRIVSDAVRDVNMERI